MSLIQNDVPDRQLIYYQPGIGTYTNPGIFTPLSMKLANMLDQAFAWCAHQSHYDFALTVCS
jgi:uncharacterized protein (DUF2235 family)